MVSMMKVSVVLSGVGVVLVDEFAESHSTIKPAHEILALFVLRKFILQICMRSHPDCTDAQARLSLRWSPLR